ncbi:MAG: hypothetical protein HC922_07730 [Leptolyngbyaceae cyanobacterium SM2_3_12]|nr:hypothetical protein [Leptolyngbyaceae cyanobacterium SM2_3_12]
MAECLRTPGRATLSVIAETAGMSRSIVHRHQQSIAHAEQYLESSGWDTVVGFQWLQDRTYTPWQSQLMHPQMSRAAVDVE